MGPCCHLVATPCLAAFGANALTPLPQAAAQKHTEDWSTETRFCLRSVVLEAWAGLDDFGKAHICPSFLYSQTLAAGPILCPQTNPRAMGSPAAITRVMAGNRWPWLRSQLGLRGDLSSRLDFTSSDFYGLGLAPSPHLKLSPTFLICIMEMRMMMIFSLQGRQEDHTGDHGAYSIGKMGETEAREGRD